MTMRTISNFLSNLSIRSKLILGYLAASILYFTATWLFVFPAMQRAIEENVESGLNNTTKGILNLVQTAADASIKNYLRAVAE